MNFRAACFAFSLSPLLFGADPKATPEQARKFINDAEQKLLLLSVDSAQADWIKSTYITDDTEAVAAKLDQAQIDATVRFAKESVLFDRIALPPLDQRKINLLKNSLTLATPAAPAEAAEVPRLETSLE